MTELEEGLNYCLFVHHHASLKYLKKPFRAVNALPLCQIAERFSNRNPFNAIIDLLWFCGKT